MTGTKLPVLQVRFPQKIVLDDTHPITFIPARPRPHLLMTRTEDQMIIALSNPRIAATKNETLPDSRLLNDEFSFSG